jgi:hypothetical protein
MEKYEEILNELNTPLISEQDSIYLNHKIFQKYTSQPYYKYAFDLLDTLCKKTNYQNKKQLLHISFTYLIYILYNCGNIAYLSNFDIMILCCFYLAIKAIIKQNTIPCMSKFKKIYIEKYNNYKNEEIIKAEIICLKLLKYKINILTVHDCLYYLLYNNQDLFNKALENYENEKMLNINDYIYKKPLDLAKEIIHNLDIKVKLKYPKIIKKKIILNSTNINISKYQNKTNRVIASNFCNNKNDNQIDKNSSKNFIYNKFSTIVNSKNSQVSLLFPKTEKHYSIYKKNSSKKNKNKSNNVLNSSNLVNSFSKMDIELNSSPFNNTNCSSSPCGSDGLSSFVQQNNSGINILTKYGNNSPNEIFQKPCLYKKNMKTSFILYKKSNRYINTKTNLDLSQEKILEESPIDKIKDCYLSNTFYSKRKRNEYKNKYI